MKADEVAKLPNGTQVRAFPRGSCRGTEYFVEHDGETAWLVIEQDARPLYQRRTVDPLSSPLWWSWDFEVLD